MNRSGSNALRDRRGVLHLGQHRTTRYLFPQRAGRLSLRNGTQSFAKIWQALALVYQLVQEGKTATQREAYYCLVKHFKSQTEFNNTLQDLVAFIGCTRDSLGICASSSGGIAGLLLWKENGGNWENCSTSSNGKRIPGSIDDTTQFKSMGARYILVVEKDAVFTYLCGQRIWDSLPCILMTGCGYPSLSVRALLKQLQTQFHLPVLGLFDYNPHGLRILLTYQYGSVRMGTESYAYAVDIHWLGVHYKDLFEDDGSPKVSPSSLQTWTASDQRVSNGLKSRLQHCTGVPDYMRELELMERKETKAEIEALNGHGAAGGGMDTLENKIIHKILCKKYY